MLYEMWITKCSVAGQQAFDQMTEAEKIDFEGKWREAYMAAKGMILMEAQCSWANESYLNWGLNVLPDLDARLTLYNKMQEAGLFRYIEGMSVLGTSDEEGNLPSFFPPVYLLSMQHTEPGAMMARKALSPDELNELLASERASFERNGGCQVINCNSYWANEAYAAFGIEAFPSLEALHAYKDDLYQLHWSQYFPGESIVGLPMEYPPTGQGG